MDKSSKKRRFAAAELEEGDHLRDGGLLTPGSEEDVTAEEAAVAKEKQRKADRKEQRERKKLKRAKQLESDQDGAGTAPAAKSSTKKPRTTHNGESPVEGKGKAVDAAEKKTKRSRYIAFVGNLPFTATTDAVSKHFTSIQPFRLRHLTQKAPPGKDGQEPPSKGYAFLEFEDQARMETCLKLFHHSKFNDGRSPARRINIELTAGGGGKLSQVRNSRIQTKNEKLTEERRKNALKEKEKSGGAGGGKTTTTEGPDSTSVTDFGDVHPSRMKRVDKAGR